MLDWFLQSSKTDRALVLLLASGFCFVMYAAFRSLTGTHQHVTWYRGLHTTPAFQMMMWVGAFPLIIPAAIILFRRRRALLTAPYIGNLRSRIFHSRDCEYQLRINSEFLRYPLASENEAKNLRFKPCNWCIRQGAPIT